MPCFISLYLSSMNYFINCLWCLVRGCRGPGKLLSVFGCFQLMHLKEHMPSYVRLSNKPVRRLFLRTLFSQGNFENAQSLRCPFPPFGEMFAASSLLTSPLCQCRLCLVSPQPCLHTPMTLCHPNACSPSNPTCLVLSITEWIHSVLQLLLRAVCSFHHYTSFQLM